MARYTHARNSFEQGEVSPGSFGRSDLPIYHQMCEQLKNFIPRLLGGVSRRTGNKFLPETFADSQINDYSASGSIVKLIQASFSYDKQSFIILVPSYIKRYSVNNLSYGGSLSHIGAVTAIGTKTYGTDWVPLGQVEQWAQFGNLIVVTNGTYPPLFIAGISVANERYFLLGEGKLTSLNTLDTFVTSGWTLFPFDPVNVTATTFALSAVTVGTGRTLTASAATFTSGMVGMYVRMNNGATTGHALITGFTNSTTVTVEVKSVVDAAFLSPAASVSWSLSQWGGAARGWPRSCAFYKERLYFGGNTYMPDGIWGSEIGDLYQFSLLSPIATLAAADPYNARIGQSESKFVNHLFPKENLFANMESKECYLSPPNKDLSVSATNIEVQSHSAFGAAQLQPAPHKESMVYVGWTDDIASTYGRKILELLFNPKDDRYEVDDLSERTPDITRDRAITTSAVVQRPTFVGLAVTKRPNPVIWTRDSTGRLYSITRNKKTGAIGWAHHPLGGSYLSGDAKVVDIIDCDGQLVLAVLRNTGGNADQICYEIMSEEFVSSVLNPTTGSPIYPIYLDYSITGTVSAGAVTGLNHLNGNTVHALVGGDYLGTYVVSGNAITVGTSHNGKIAIIGYNYESLLIPTALESNALLGSGLGQIKRTNEVVVEFERTVGAKVGIVGNETNENILQFRDASDLASAPIPLFTGEKVVPITAPYERKQNVYIKQDKPFPMTVNAIIVKGQLYD